jgi:hypothetical protein
MRRARIFRRLLFIHHMPSPLRGNAKKEEWQDEKLGPSGQRKPDGVEDDDEALLEKVLAGPFSTANMLHK